MITQEKLSKLKRILDKDLPPGRWDDVEDTSFFFEADKPTVTALIDAIEKLKNGLEWYAQGNHFCGSYWAIENEAQDIGVRARQVLAEVFGSKAEQPRPQTDQGAGIGAHVNGGPEEGAK